MRVVACEGVVDVDSEDGGQALIAEIDSAEPGFFVRLHSWDAEGQHVLMNRLRGKRVRVVVDIIEED